MNPDFATIALARYQARQGLRQRYRSAGIKTTGVPYPELWLEADRYLAEHKEEIMGWATRACAEIKLSAPKSKR